MKSVRLISLTAWLACGACASGGEHKKPDDGLDDLGDHTSERDAATSQSSVTTNDASIDAAVESMTSDSYSSTANTSEVDAGDDAQTSSHNPFHDVDARVSDDSVGDAGSLIIEPDVETYDLQTLCSSIWELQGQVLAVDLTETVEQGEWAAVRDFVTALDAGTSATSLEPGVDAGAKDGQACAERFAPYLIQCEQGAIVLQSPSLVYANGPEVGGELVTVGCWEQQCAVACVPAVVESLAKVRALLSPVLPSAVPDGSPPVTTGLVRINGVEVEAVATLEIVGRLE